MKRFTKETTAKFFHVPISNVERLYADNARDLRSFAVKAGSSKYRGKTAKEWNAFAIHAEKQSLPIDGD